jgi:hypothetical protein
MVGRPAKPHKCIVCNDTDPNNFYTKHKMRCKKHHNALKVKTGKRKDGFEKLPTDKQTEFMAEINDKTIIELSEKYNVPKYIISRMRVRNQPVDS